MKYPSLQNNLTQSLDENDENKNKTEERGTILSSKSTRPMISVISDKLPVGTGPRKPITNKKFSRSNHSIMIHSFAPKISFTDHRIRNVTFISKLALTDHDICDVFHTTQTHSTDYEKSYINGIHNIFSSFPYFDRFQENITSTQQMRTNASVNYDPSLAGYRQYEASTTQEEAIFSHYLFHKEIKISTNQIRNCSSPINITG